MSFQADIENTRRQLAAANGAEAAGAIRAAAGLADKLAKRGDMDLAIDLLEEAAATAKVSERNELLVKVLEQRALLLTQAERSREAIAVIDQALEAVQQLEPANPSMAQELEIRRALVLANLGRLPEAIENIRGILGPMEQEKAVPAYARLLGLLGSLYLRSAQNQKAEESFR